MPLIKPKFVPGIVKDYSTLSIEGGWTDSDKIRFVDGKPQVVGGSEELSVDVFQAIPFDDVVFDSVVFDTTTATVPEKYAGQARGAHTWMDNDGNRYVAWGTTAGLYVLYNNTVYDITPADFTPETAVSTLPYGAGPYGMGVYGRARRVVWTLQNWGENLLANPQLGKLYEWQPGAAKALTVTNAPDIINSFFVSPERIVVLLGTTEFGGSLYNPMLVRWSDQGDNTQWTPAPTNSAGEYPIASGSKLVAGLAVRGLNLLWTDDAIYSMQFTGSLSNVFVIRCIGRNCGLISLRAMCSSESAVFWMSTADNFHMFNGQSTSDVPCPIRKDVFEHIYPDSEDKIHASWNGAYGEAWFFYSDLRDGTGEISRYASVNAQGQWAPGSSDRTAWAASTVFPHPIAFGANTHKLYYEEVPNAGGSGGPLEAFLESGFIDVGDGDTLYKITRIVPDFGNQGPTVNISLKTKLWPNETATTSGPYAATPTTTKIDTRIKAREMAVRLASSGSAPNSFWNLGAIGFDSEQSGEKR